MYSKDFQALLSKYVFVIESQIHLRLSGWIMISQRKHYCLLRLLVSGLLSASFYGLF